MSRTPVAVTDDEARATAEDFGIGRYWKALRDHMVACGAWKIKDETLV